MIGYALASFVSGVPITEEIATALLANLRRVEAMWVKQLTDPQSANAREWGCAANVDLFWTPETGMISPNPSLVVVRLMPALPPGTPEGFIADHDIDELGRPRCSISYVAAGSDWPSAASHELAECRVNPLLDQQSPKAPDGTTWDLEVCDPVEGSDYVEAGTNVRVANAVGPAFFSIQNGPLDIAGYAMGPFQQLVTGYHDGSAGQQFGAMMLTSKRYEVATNGVRGKKVRRAT